MMHHSQDPFYVLQSDVQSSVHGLTVMYERWRALISSSSSASSSTPFVSPSFTQPSSASTISSPSHRSLLMSNEEEIEFAHDEVVQAIKHIESDLSLLEQSIRKVENDKKRFQNVIDEEEIKRRKYFVLSTKDQLTKISTALRTFNQNYLDSNKSKNDQSYSYGKTSSTRSNSSDLLLLQQKQQQQQQQQQKLRQQQQTTTTTIGRQKNLDKKQEYELEELGERVSTLEQISLQIHSELETQNLIIEELQEDVSFTNSKMKFAMKNLDKLFDSTSERSQWGLIIFMVILLAILLFIAIYI